MTAKGKDAAEALLVVIKALESLTEAERHWVLQSAATRWSANVSAPVINSGGPAPTSTTTNFFPTADIQAAIANQDVRSFIRIKKPATDVQRVACLGYYLSKTTGQPGFSSKAVSQAHIDSGGSTINMPRALDNATRQSKYLSNRGPKEKQVTTLGEDVVAALPDQQRVKEVEIEGKAKGRPKRKSRKKA